MYDASAYGDSGPVAVTIPSYESPDMPSILYSWAAENISMPKEGFAEPLGAYWCPNDINNNDSSVSTAYASKEVVLAASAIFTPYLLMVSGIGPKDVLTAAKVPVKLDAPGVGDNWSLHCNR